ncbi:MAG: methyltransferase domain-containing protein [Alphaproteobacteria bacterium]|nr:methyltransferase domain-containing protein [Alphaproteobacteria bacterium]
MTDPDPTDPAYWDSAVANYEAQAAPFTGFFAEAALAMLDLRPGQRLLDVATGTGAAALAAARKGMSVTAIDFSHGMIERVRAHGLPNIVARQMDGQALDLPGAAFDAAVSIFGVMLFADWRAGLSEMARVVRPGGAAAVAAWRNPSGAATSLLLSETCAALFPEMEQPIPWSGLTALADPGRLSAAMIEAGFADPLVTEMTHAFNLKVEILDDAGRLFAMIPVWRALDDAQKALVLEAIRDRAARERVGELLPIPSTALIAVARRP